ncbi:Sip1-related alpha-galactosidase [Actomonas aquatica]|uniref:Sip1-related alpha-galactosidase n=1 Tax=Actomonas aquatica TaxID=2866162 RepID=A0ABZ1C7A2_9BACT|nr:Sip1-related alpha-galactosidase [Opitutus sp. WL0086]WRQ86394.1 Sip1-related alpha-galactosidase [Opitutus sp. WL0086]
MSCPSPSPSTHPRAHPAAPTDVLRRMLPGLDVSDWKLHPDACGTGVFLAPAVTPPHPAAAATATFALGPVAGLRRFTASFRCSPFWVRPTVGLDIAEVPPGTMWLLAETTADTYVLFVPLLGDHCAFTLQGDADGLSLHAETGDPAVPVAAEVGLFVASGPDPFALLHRAAEAVRRQQNLSPAPADLPVPDFVELFGWCTWDAFYHEVSPAKVLEGLRAFAAAGVSPRLLILDDGWQSIKTAPGGEKVLTDWQPNARFGHDLSALVQTSKTTFGISRFLVWHALTGYWGGVCPKALPACAPRRVPRTFSPALLVQDKTGELAKWGPAVNVPSAAAVADFFENYHHHLRAQGVDGVKVDNQAVLEGVASGLGGRVPLSRAYRRALAASAQRHFDGRVLHCMSCSPEGLYLGHASLMRTSDDFWPDRAASHGQHLYNNAHASLWWGEFIRPDWDMFQSGHPRGGFHAAARVLSGGPVYVSDSPGQHDAALLRQLVLSDGSVLRADGPGCLTRDLLFTDPTREPALLKIFNRVGDTGLLGVFNAQAPRDAQPAATAASPARLTGTTGVDDVADLAGDAFVAYHARTRRLVPCDRHTRLEFDLAAGEWELITFAPVVDGCAVIGLADKLNSAAAVSSRRDTADGTITELNLRDGGEFLAWTPQPPAAVHCDGATVPFTHTTDGAVRAHLPTGAPRHVMLRWS